MPSKGRTFSSSGIYHIILRSVNQQIIFEEDADYQKFLYILSDCTEKHDVDIYAYCIMSNHIHLMIRSDREQLAPLFKGIGAKFVHWYNNKYKRYGHLFQGRFHSKPIEDRRYYLATLIYIHNNPVAAGICRIPSEYPWSSYKAFYGAKNPLINLEYSCHVAGSLKALQAFFAGNSDMADPFEDDEYEHGKTKLYVNDEDALELFKDLTGYSSTHEIVDIPKMFRNDIIRMLRENNLTVKQISRLLGISESTIKRICA